MCRLQFVSTEPCRRALWEDRSDLRPEPHSSEREGGRGVCLWLVTSACQPGPMQRSRMAFTANAPRRIRGRGGGGFHEGWKAGVPPEFRVMSLVWAAFVCCHNVEGHHSCLFLNGKLSDTVLLPKHSTCTAVAQLLHGQGHRASLRRATQECLRLSPPELTKKQPHPVHSSVGTSAW